jgi:hypothetical protein
MRKHGLFPEQLPGDYWHPEERRRHEWPGAG